jgi:hypothetical protein
VRSSDAAVPTAASFFYELLLIALAAVICRDKDAKCLHRQAGRPLEIQAGEVCVRQLSLASSARGPGEFPQSWIEVRKLTVRNRPDPTYGYHWLFRIPIHLCGEPMARSPSIAERVEAVIRRMDGAPLCDECIVDRLDLSSIAQASVATGAAVGDRGFERSKGPCGLCGEPRHFIRHKC